MSFAIGMLFASAQLALAARITKSFAAGDYSQVDNHYENCDNLDGDPTAQMNCCCGTADGTVGCIEDVLTSDLNGATYRDFLKQSQAAKTRKCTKCMDYVHALEDVNEDDRKACLER